MKKIIKFKGFNLVEIMVAITVLGILAGIAVPIVSNYTIRAKVAKALSYAEILKQSYSEYYLNNGSAPPDFTAMGLTSYSDEIILSTSYFPARGSIGELRIDLLMSEVGATGGLCSDVLYWIKPTYENKMLTWKCNVHVDANPACNTFLQRISPPECY